MLLEAQGIRASYGNKKTVLHGLSLAIRPGQIATLLGHNGAGKTTALKTIIGLMPVEAGQITFEGRAIGHLSTDARVGLGLRLLPERGGVFPNLTVQENLAVAEQNQPHREGQRFSSTNIFELFPDLYGKRQQRAGSMSGGQQQMLALGICLIGHPRVLLLDEPSVGLQPNLVERLFDQIRELAAGFGLSVLLVEQNVAEALRVADWVLVLKNGHLIFDDSVAVAKQQDLWSLF